MDSKPNSNVESVHEYKMAQLFQISFGIFTPRALHHVISSNHWKCCPPFDLDNLHFFTMFLCANSFC